MTLTPSKLLDWQGRAAVILASGPSLNLPDVDQVLGSGLPTIAINRSFELAPWANVVYMGDLRAIQEYGPRVLKPQLWSCSELAATLHGAQWTRFSPGEGLGKDRIMGNGNSGFQAINLAYLFGARKIILLGFDMKPGPAGEKHWHMDHPVPLVQTQCFPEWILKGRKLADDLRAAGADCVDCTPGGALEGFRKGQLGEELAKCLVPAS